jgi:hypothetical protein
MNRDPDRMMKILLAHLAAIRDGSTEFDSPEAFEAIAARVPGLTVLDVYETADYCASMGRQLRRVWRGTAKR